MNVNYKKTFKLSTLLIASLLIGLASAASYKYLYIDGTVTVGTQKIVWIQSGTGEIAGDTATVGLSVEPGVSTDFNDTLYLKNKDTSDHNLTITVTTAVSSDFTYFYIYIYENFTSPGSWQLVDGLDVKTLNDQYSTYTGNSPLQDDSYYKLDFGVKPTTGASGPYNFDVKVTFE